MAIGLPKLEQEFYAAAQAASARDKKGVVALILRDAKAAGLHEVVWESDIPAELGEANRRNVERCMTGSDMGTPSKVYLAVIPPDGESGAATLAPALALLDNYSADYVAGPPDMSEAECGELAAWIKKRREKGGNTEKAVLPHTAADHMGIVNFTTDDIKAGAETFTAGEYCSRIAGILAGVPSTCSATSCVLPEVTGVPAVEDADARVGKGELFLIRDGVQVEIARAVNSLVTVGADQREDWKKVKIVETMDLLTYFGTTTIKHGYRGKCANSYPNKLLLLLAFETFFKTLEPDILQKGRSSMDLDLDNQRKWLKNSGADVGSMTDQEIREADTGSYVFLLGLVKILDTMEDFLIRYEV